jgi:hypothetical protein
MDRTTTMPALDEMNILIPCTSPDFERDVVALGAPPAAAILAD